MLSFIIHEYFPQEVISLLYTLDEYLTPGKYPSQYFVYMTF